LDITPDEIVKNTNCLAGMRCPECGANEYFEIQGTWSGALYLYDDGIDMKDGGHWDWDDENHAECPECDWQGTIADLRGESKTGESSDV
jgi:Zn ribbon nucleic-acid-binding protein